MPLKADFHRPLKAFFIKTDTKLLKKSLKTGILPPFRRNRAVFHLYIKPSLARYRFFVYLST